MFVRKVCIRIRNIKMSNKKSFEELKPFKVLNKINLIMASSYFLDLKSFPKRCLYRLYILTMVIFSVYFLIQHFIFVANKLEHLDPLMQTTFWFQQISGQLIIFSIQYQSQFMKSQYKLMLRKIYLAEKYLIELNKKTNFDLESRRQFFAINIEILLTFIGLVLLAVAMCICLLEDIYDLFKLFFIIINPMAQSYLTLISIINYLIYIKNKFRALQSVILDFDGNKKLLENQVFSIYRKNENFSSYFAIGEIKKWSEIYAHLYHASNSVNKMFGLSNLAIICKY